MLAPPKKPSGKAVEKAKQFLKGILRDGPKDAEEVLKAAHDAGISETTLRAAKKELQVKAEGAGGIAGEGKCMWVLPLARGEDIWDGEGVVRH